MPPAAAANAESLFTAIRSGDADAVRALLDGNPGLLDSRDAQSGVSPLMIALYHGQRPIADELLQRLGPDRLTIHEAAASGSIARIEQLLSEDSGAVNAWSADGFQPLGLAAFFGQPRAAELLLARGGELNTAARHPFGVTALHAALAGPTPELSRALVAAGADVNATQSSGETPLHETAFSGSLELTQMLLEHGANPKARDGQGKTPAEIARERGHAAVAELLESST